MTKLLLLAVNDSADAEKRVQWLRSHNYIVEVVADGKKALSFLEANQVDVIVLADDVFGMSCVEICRFYRQQGGQTPVLILASQQGGQHSAEVALEAGADDFVLNACKLSELSARIRALLRRPPRILNSLLQVGGIVMETDSGKVFRGDCELSLQPMELKLLEFLMRHADEIFSAHSLHLRVWHDDSNSSTETVRTHIKTLRKKLDDESGQSLIKTVHGRGYKLQGH